MPEETQDSMKLAIDEENQSLNNAIRAYLEGRVVELNIKLRDMSNELEELRGDKAGTDRHEET